MCIWIDWQDNLICLSPTMQHNVYTVCIMDTIKIGYVMCIMDIFLKKIDHLLESLVKYLFYLFIYLFIIKLLQMCLNWICLLSSLGFSKESTSSFRGRPMTTRRATHVDEVLWTEEKTCCLFSSLECFQCGYWYLSLVLVKYKWTTVQSLEVGHLNKMEAVQFEDNWDSILCPFLERINVMSLYF